MSVQFGVASMTFNSVNIGYLQGVTLDITFDTAKLYSGAGLFPVDQRTHTGSITGNAEFADLTAVAMEALLGGSRSNSTITLTNTSQPQSFQMVTTLVTDGISFILTFTKCRTTKFSLSMVRDNHLIPNFDFEISADTDGSVGTIDVGDVS